MTEQNQLGTKSRRETAGGPLLKRVSHHYLPVSNLAKAVAWYEETFGLSVRSRDEGGAILVLGNGQWLFLLETEEPRTANFLTRDWEAGGGLYEMFSLTFEVEDIVGLHKRLRERGVDAEPLGDLGSCGLQFTFKDPDGNKFNVWQDAQ